MSLKIKPYDAPRKQLTPAQKIASTRAFKLFRLRGLYSLAWAFGVSPVTISAIKTKRIWAHVD